MAKEYNIGRFTEVAHFMRPVYTETGTGEREVAWPMACSRFCEVTNAVHAEELEQDARTGEQSYRLTCWLVPEATSEWKITYRGSLYDITRVEQQRSGVAFYTIKRSDLCNE